MKKYLLTLSFLIVIIVVFIIIYSYKINIEPISNISEIERLFSISLTDAKNVEAYNINKSGGYAWVRFDIASKHVESFLSKSYFTDKLVYNSREIQKALSFNTSIERMDNSSIKKWVPNDFKPLSGYSNDSKSVLIGKNKIGDLKVFICDFGSR